MAKKQTQPTGGVTDGSLAAAVLTKYGRDNGFGLHTFNVLYTLKRPEGTTGRVTIKIGTPNGMIDVAPTIMTVLGAAMGVRDFALVKSATGKSESWYSAEVVKRLFTAGYELTHWNKLHRRGESAARSAVAPTVVDAKAFL